MKILVTGAAGFIGFHTCLKLASQGHEVYGIDNINDYYNPKLKFDRLNELPDWYQYLVFLVCSAALGIKGLDKFRKK